MSENKTITFQEAVSKLLNAKRITHGGHAYCVKLAPRAPGGPLSVERHPEPGGTFRVVWFFPHDNVDVRDTGETLALTAEYGEEFTFLLSDKEVTHFTTAETAAAIMDSIHSEVCRQDEGSDSAYEELYEVATKAGLGFPGIWSWVALLADAARPRMETLWASGDIEFIDCVHAVAQEFHNFITLPQRRPELVGAMTREQAVELWEDAARCVREHQSKVAKEKEAGRG